MQIESLAASWLPRVIRLARMEAARLGFSDVEEMESMAGVELGLALMDASVIKPEKLWGYVSLRVRRRLWKLVRTEEREHGRRERYKTVLLER